MSSRRHSRMHARPAQRRRRERTFRWSEHRAAAVAPGRPLDSDGVRTSYHAALVGEYLIENLPESRSRSNTPASSAIAIRRWTAIQSCWLSPSRARQRIPWRPYGSSKRKGIPRWRLQRRRQQHRSRGDGGVYLHAGPEIGVASTKAFTSQVTVLTMARLYLGRIRHLSSLQGAQMIRDLRAMAHAIRLALSCEESVKRIADRYFQVHNFLYMGRQYLYPVALEGALKLKEISYIHAEGYPAAEMKHGPIALVDEETPSVFNIRIASCPQLKGSDSSHSTVTLSQVPRLSTSQPRAARVKARIAVDYGYQAASNPHIRHEITRPARAATLHRPSRQSRSLDATGLTSQAHHLANTPARDGMRNGALRHGCLPVLFVYQSDWPHVHLCGRVALGVDVANLLQFERPFQRDRIEILPAHVEEVMDLK